MAAYYYRHIDGTIVITHDLVATFAEDHAVICRFLRDGKWIYGFVFSSNLSPLPREDQVRIKMFGA